MRVSQLARAGSSNASNAPRLAVICLKSWPFVFTVTLLFTFLRNILPNLIVEVFKVVPIHVAVGTAEMPANLTKNRRKPHCKLIKQTGKVTSVYQEGCRRIQ